MKAPYVVALIAAFYLLALIIGYDVVEYRHRASVAQSSRSLRALDPQDEADVEPMIFAETPSPTPAEEPHSAQICGLGEWSKYLWWLIVLYVFWAQALVCDEYFVPSIDAMCEKFAIPEDVAGATLMALGCNGPEMFTNIMGLFGGGEGEGGDLGVGAIIGSEIFNLLCIVGAAIIFAPESKMPLELDVISFSRDCFFYSASIAALYLVLSDQIVTITESLLLVLGTVIFAITVTFTPRFKAWYRPKTPELDDSVNATASMNMTRRTSVEEAEFHPDRGVLLQVRTRPHNRMMSRTINWSRAMAILKDGKITLVGNNVKRDAESILELIEQQEDQSRARANTFDGLQARHRLHSTGSNLGGSKKRVSNPPAPRVGQSFDNVEMPVIGGTASARDVTSSQSAQNVGATTSDAARAPQRLVSAPISAAPTSREGKEEFALEINRLYHLNANLRDRTQFEVCVQPTTVGVPPCIWEFKTRSATECQKWMDAIKAEAELLRIDVQNEDLEPAHAPSKRGQVMHWFMFPVEFVFHISVPDCNKPKWRPWYPAAFLMSMVWLAFFSKLVVSVCLHIHDGFGIPVPILGLSLAAVGSSFPNLVASISVAKIGKSDMAIANALGSNIQNVFLALGIPWTMKTLTDYSNGVMPGQPGGPLAEIGGKKVPRGSIIVASEGLTEGVMFMAVTLILLILFVLAGKCKLGRIYGVIFVIIYFVWLFTAILRGYHVI